MKTLKKFKHVNATTIEEATGILKQYGDKAWVIAGGTDLMGTMRFDVLRDYPEVIINLKKIPGLDYIKEENSTLKIGALTKLEDIAENPAIKKHYLALSEAAGRTASPHIRVMGTIAGNICQINRCWYFRTEDNQFDCLRKGSGMCYAAVGENRYHSIFGASRVATPPCASNCAAGNDIPSYLCNIRNGDVAEAAETLINTNPLAAITGRVCPHNCEKDCNRCELDEAISIRSIERFVGDYMLANAGKLYKAPGKETRKKVAVVGSGPAGLAAAYFLRQLGHSVTIFEALDEAGGVLTYGIPPYRLQKDVVKKQVEAIVDTGVEIKYKVQVGKDITLDKLIKDYDAVFCATGAWKQAALNIKDEELLTSGLEFLTRVNRGLKKLSAKKVLVIGGGSVAVDVATSVLRMGVKDVTMACLESREEMPAQSDEIEQALKEGIKVMPSWGPARILKENGKVSGMEMVRCSSVFNKEHRFAPTYDEKVKIKVEADMIVLAIGQRPIVTYAEPALKTNRGLIAVDPQTQVTSNVKVFAAGDATLSGSLSVIAAVAGGRRAAAAINEYLGGKAALDIEKKTEHLPVYEGDYMKKLSRIKTPQLPLAKFSLNAEDVLGMDSKAVKTEADRCLNCGCVAVNPSDLAPALVSLDATIVTTKRTIKAEEFWVADRGLKPTVLANDEIVTEIQVPKPAAGVKSAFVKFALRRAIDFPIANCAVVIESEGGLVKSARICLNAVYCNPYRAAKAEKAIKGKAIDETNAEIAGTAAVSDAVALPYNKYKIQIAKALVKRMILACK